MSELLVEELGLDARQDHHGLAFEEDLEVDSLGVVELLMALEDNFGVQIPDEEAEQLTTVGEAVDLVMRSSADRTIVNERRVVATGLGQSQRSGTTSTTSGRTSSPGRAVYRASTRSIVSDITTKIAAEIKDFDREDYMPRRKRGAWTRAPSTSGSPPSRRSTMRASTTRRTTRPRCAPASCRDRHRRRGDLRGRQCECCTSGGRAACRPRDRHDHLEHGWRAGSIDFNLYGPNTHRVTACAASANAIGDAAEVIKRGAADVMVAGGGEASITRFAVGGFRPGRALQHQQRRSGRRLATIRCDSGRFVMGEGLPSLSSRSTSRQGRGAHIYGEVSGTACRRRLSHHAAEARRAGAARSMTMRSRTPVWPEELDYINAHGTSTPANDTTETAAIKTAFGDGAHHGSRSRRPSR